MRIQSTICLYLKTGSDGFIAYGGAHSDYQCLSEEQHSAYIDSCLTRSIASQTKLRSRLKVNQYILQETRRLVRGTSLSVNLDRDL